ncbi:MAG TPA: lysylphosphatidylglycerol synthase transmembrane domain-containing protein [Gemmatimonadaceae bacterium]|nr:lysylphosphatidylglycerol synthase transmembrane domain-containing protein [Gemmatimonadaceae bacterium]
MSRGWRRALHAAVTAAALLLLLAAARTVHWGEVWRAVRHASPAVLLAAAIVNLLSLLARGTRWWLFLRASGAPSLGTALRGAVVASGLNNVLPANGGEAARVMLVARREGVSSATVLATVALDRLVELLSCVALLVAAPLVLPLPAPLRDWRGRGAAALAVVVALCALLMWRAARRRPGAALPPLAAPTAGRLPAVRAYLARFAHGVTGLALPRRVGAALALSLLSWAGQAAVYHLTSRAAGFPASFAASAAAMLAVNLAFVVQTTPGNVGVFQLVYALVMAAFGLPHSAAVGVALLIQALQIVPVTALALLLAPHLARRRHA